MCGVCWSFCLKKEKIKNIVVFFNIFYIKELTVFLILFFFFFSKNNTNAQKKYIFVFFFPKEKKIYIYNISQKKEKGGES
jgi:hypothetical protein